MWTDFWNRIRQKEVELIVWIGIAFVAGVVVINGLMIRDAILRSSQDGCIDRAEDILNSDNKNYRRSEYWLESCKEIDDLLQKAFSEE